MPAPSGRNIAGKNPLNWYRLTGKFILMKQRQKSLFAGMLLIALLGGLISCQQASRQQERDVEFRFKRGQEYFQNEKYFKAIEDFKFVVLNNPGGENADDAQLYLADSHFRQEEYVVASSEYRRLMQRYPESQLVEQAQYKLGMCFVELSPHYALDQEYTRRAINQLQRFLEEYPNSRYQQEITSQIQKLRNKLSRKMYRNGHLYFILDQYDSALIYYDNLLNQYYDTAWSNQTRLERAIALKELNRPQEALAQIEELLNRQPEKSIRTKAEDLRLTLRTQVENLTQSRTNE